MRAVWLVLAALPLIAAIGCGRAAESPPPEPPRSEVEQGPVRLSVQFDPALPTLAEWATLTVVVDHQPGVTLQRPEFGPQFGDFRVIDAREELPRVEANREIVQWIYTLEPIRPGRAAVWPVDVAFTDTRPDGDGKRHLISSKPLVVELSTTVKAEPPLLAGLRPEAAPVALPFSRLTVFGWLAVILAVVAAATYAIHRRRLRRNAIAARALTPAEIAYRELRKIMDDALAHHDVKLFYVALTGVVRRFIERTTTIRAPEQTTEEFLHEISVRQTFPAEENGRLKNFLEAADLVKFAAHRPRRENIDAALDRAREFIDARCNAMAAAENENGRAEEAEENKTEVKEVAPC